MRLHLSTKNLHLGITFKEKLILDDDGEEVSNTGGQFEPANEADEVEDLNSTEFGFQPAVKRA